MSYVSSSEGSMSYLPSTEDVVSAYVELRDRMISFLRSLPENVAGVVVPHCPDWTVQETVSHMVGVPEAILSGDLDGIASDAWTQRQVERHRGDSLKDLADAWEKDSEQFLKVLPMIPIAAMTQLVFDVASHEHDVRNAVGQPGARDSLSVGVGVRFMKHAADSRGDIDVSQMDQWTASTFDVFRSVGGRRSKEQMAADGIDTALIEKLLRPMPISIPAVSIPE